MSYLKLKQDRRDFLRHMAQTGVLMPMAYQLLGQKALAAPGAIARVIYVYYPNGVQYDTGHNGLVYHPRSGNGTRGTSINLENTCLEAFANTAYNGQNYDLRNDMVFLRNLELHGQQDSHADGAAAIWSCNSGASTTIDAEVARRLHNAEPLATEHLNIGTYARQTGMSRKDGQDIATEINPHNVLNQLKSYSGNDTTGGAGTGDSDTLAILDVLANDLANLEAVSLSNVELAKVEAHKTQFEELRRRLDSGPISCGDINAVQLRSNSGWRFTDQKENWTAILRDQIDLAVTALACGMTHVVTLKHAEHTADIGLQNTPEVQPILAQLAGQPDHNNYMLDHSASHTQAAAHLEISKWFHTQMAYLVAQLKARDMLHNTVVVALSENADGSDHSANDGGWWVAGGSDAIDTGKVLDVNGARHSSLLVDIARATNVGINSYGTSEGIINGFLKS